MIRLHGPKCNTRAKLKIKGKIHINEKHKQSGGNLSTDDDERAQKKFDALRRRSSGSAGQLCRRSKRGSGCLTPAPRSGAGLLPPESRGPRSDGPVRWHWRIRSALAERNEGHDAWV